MTFLKKLGTILANIAGVAAGIGPLVLPFLGSGKTASAVSEYVPKVTQDLTSIAQVVVQVESIIQTPGSGVAKLKAATPLVASIIKTSELVVGKQIQNNDLFIQGCTKIADGMADVLNSIHPDAAAHSS